MGKLWASKKEGKEQRRLSPTFIRRLSWGAQKRIGPGYLGTDRTMGYSENARRDQLGFKQLKGACLWTQGTKIGMSHQPPMAQKKGWWPRNKHLIKRSMVPWETQESGSWRKVTEDLSAWQWEIYPFRENDKRRSSQKVGLKMSI